MWLAYIIMWPSIYGLASGERFRLCPRALVAVTPLLLLGFITAEADIEDF